MLCSPDRFRGVIRLLTLSGALWTVAPRGLEAEERAVPVVDLHVDLAYQHIYKGRSFAEGSGQITRSKLQSGAVRGLVLPLYLPRDASPEGRTRAELERAYAGVFSAILATDPYALPGCAVREAGGTSRGVDTYLAFEGSGQFAGHTDELERWALRGVRSFGLVHAEHNELATSSGQSESSSQGLTDAGREYVRKVFAIEGLVDVSHASDASTNEVLNLAKLLSGRVIATHSNARALAPHPRNLTDDQIRSIAAVGGVVGVNFHQPYLSRSGGRRAEFEDLVRQLEHLRKVGGIDVVALGSDFEGGIRPVAGLADAGKFQVLARALRRAGWSRPEIEQVFFRNAERVLCASR